MAPASESFAVVAFKARVRMGLSQAKAAKLLGITDRTLLEIEKGRARLAIYEEVGILKVYEDAPFVPNEQRARHGPAAPKLPKKRRQRKKR